MRALIAVLLLFQSINTTLAEEGEAPVQRYIDLGEFIINLEGNHTAKLTAQLYVTSEIMETLTKLHQPHIKGVILERFGELSLKKIKSRKKRKRFIKKLTKKIRKSIPKYDLPATDAEQPPLDQQDFREILITSLIYQ